MDKFDLSMIFLAVVILALGLWLAVTPFDIFVTLLLAIFSPLSISSLVTAVVEVKGLRNDIEKIREVFGGMIK
jgi:hypothetical protein